MIIMNGVISCLYFHTIDKIQVLKLLVPVLNISRREQPNFVCRSKVIKIPFPKNRAGKSVKQVNKLELPKLTSNPTLAQEKRNFNCSSTYKIFCLL